jgi:hypothetical protein
LHHHGVDLLQAAALRSGAGWRRLRRWLHHLRMATVVVLVALIAAVIAGAFVLSRGPVTVEGMSLRVARALQDKIGAQWRVDVTDSSLSWEGGGPSLVVVGLTLRNAEGALILSAPQANIGIDAFSALTGDFRPRSVTFQGVDVRLILRPDGSIAFGADTAQPVVETKIPSPADVTSVDVATLGKVIGSLIDVFAGDNGPFAALERASLGKSRLFLKDSKNVERLAFDDISIDLERTGDAAHKIGMNVRGNQGNWSLNGLASGRAGRVRAAKVELVDASVSDLLLLVGQSAMPLISDARLSGEVDTSVAADGSLTKLDGRLQLSSGSARIDLPGFTKADIRESGGRVAWNPSTKVFDVVSLGIDVGGVKAAMTGKIIPPDLDQPWRADFTATGLAISSLDLGSAAYTYDKASLSLRWPDDGATLNTNAYLQRGDARVEVAVNMGLTERSPQGLTLDVAGSRISAREGLRLWPGHISADVRNYLIGALRSGTIEAVSISSRLTAREYLGSYAGEPMPDGGLKAIFSLSSVVAALDAGLPLLKDADVNGVVTGRTARVTVKDARVHANNGRSMGFSSAVFTVPETWMNFPPARLTFNVDGSADAFVSLLASPAIRNTLNLELDPALLKGNASVRANVGLTLGRALDAGDLTVSASGQLTNVSLEKALGAEKLENANLALSFDRNVLSLRGDVRAFGQPGTIEIKHQPKLGTGEAVLSFMLDEAARIKRGLNFGAAFTGSLPIKITAPLTSQSTARPKVEIDLTRAAIDGLVPGWSKPSGRAAKLSFVLAERTGGATLLDDLVLESGTLLVKGQAVLSANDNSLDSLDLSTFKLSPGDDMKVKLERSGGVSKITVRGAVIDARPFLKNINNPEPANVRRPARSGGASSEGPNFDLDLTTPILAGFNDEAITGADLKISRRGADVRQLRLSGKIGTNPVSAELTRRDSQPSTVVIRSGDGGGFLRFVDLYTRMVGGDLVVNLTPFGEAQAGAIDVREFALRNEPALRRILSEQPASAPQGDRVSGAPALAVNPNEVDFSRMKATFTRTGGRTDIRDAVIWGPQVGLSISGYIDSARDRSDLSGTYVPAYGLNNIFSQVPIVGILLGGGQYEGLFAVNFRISGLASAPTLTINPLSAIAPGIFRKFFEAGRSSDPGVVVPALPER